MRPFANFLSCSIRKSWSSFNNIYSGQSLLSITDLHALDLSLISICFPLNMHTEAASYRVFLSQERVFLYTQTTT